MVIIFVVVINSIFGSYAAMCCLGFFAKVAYVSPNPPLKKMLNVKHINSHT